MWIRSELGWAVLRKWLICCHCTGFRRSSHVSVCVFTQTATDPCSTFLVPDSCSYLEWWISTAQGCFPPSVSETQRECLWMTKYHELLPQRKICPAGRSGSGRIWQLWDGGQECPATKQTVLHTWTSGWINTFFLLRRWGPALTPREQGVSDRKIPFFLGDFNEEGC